MTNHKITGKQVEGILILFWSGSLAVGTSSAEAKQDYWASILMGALLFLPFIFLYLRLIKLYPSMNLFEIVVKIFGPVFGRIISLFYVFYAIHLGAMATNIYAIFVHVSNMPETPMVVINSIIIVTAVYCVKNGPENIARLSRVVWPVLFVSITVTFLIGIKDMQLSYLKPVLNTDFKDLLSASFTILALPLGEAVLCLSFFSAVDSETNHKKSFFQGLLITIYIFMSASLRNLLVLGIPNTELYTFPSYQAVSIISIGEFFTRIEVLIGINIIMAGFIKLCVCLYTASLGLTKILNIKDQKSTVTPCALLVLMLVGLVFTTTNEVLEFINYYRIYALIFQGFLPVIILIGAEIQNRFKSSSGSNGAVPEPKNSES